MTKLSSSSVICAAVFAVVLTPCVARAQQVVGVVGAANAAPTGRAPGKSQRTLKAGSDIFFKDHIATKRGGSAQLSFLDRSTLSVSENSDLVIDEFVYRPGETGTMTAHLTKGVMRFVGGDISHEGSATIKTPVVTIGIRGGIGTIGYVDTAKDVAAIPGVPSNFHGGAIVVNGYGTMTVRNGSSETIISRPGFAVFVGGFNEVIAAPVRFDMASAKALMNALASKPGQRGGLSQKAAASISTQTGAARFSTRIDTPRAPAINALDFTSIFHVGNALARNRSQTQQATSLQAQVAPHQAMTPSVVTPTPTSVLTSTPTPVLASTPTPVPTSTRTPAPMPAPTSTPRTTSTPMPAPMPAPAPTTSTPAVNGPTIVVTTPVGTVKIGNGNNGNHYGWGYSYGNGDGEPGRGHH